VLAALDLDGARLSVGLSGGVDSVVLVKILAGLRAQFGYALSAIHVNHGLSPHADEWQAFCVALCKRWKIPLAVERVRVRKSGGGIEAAARNARFQAFAAHAGGVLALAHHLDDQAETMLLQLLRGAGVRGLAGMHEVARRSPALDIPVLRPLLAVPRSAILQFATRHRLQWIEDESNEVLTYRRNFLRSRVMPAFGELFPAYRETMARSAAHCAEAADLLEEIGVRDGGFARDTAQLNCVRLRKLSPARAANALRAFLAANSLLAPDSASLKEMLRQLLTSKADANLTLPHDGAVLRRYRDSVFIVAAPPQKMRSPILWKGEPLLQLGAGEGAIVLSGRARGARVSALALAAAPVSVRSRTGGEKIQPDANRPRRSLKNLLQESAVPPWERSRMPLLYCGEQLVWVPGIGVDAAFQPAARDISLFVSWQRLHYTENGKKRALHDGSRPRSRTTKRTPR